MVKEQRTSEHPVDREQREEERFVDKVQMTTEHYVDKLNGQHTLAPTTTEKLA